MLTFSPPHAASSGIHPLLKQLADGRIALEHLRKARIVIDDSGQMVRVFIAGEPIEELEKIVSRIGGRTLGRYSGFISAYVPFEGLRQLMVKPVLYVEPVRRLVPLLDKSIPAIRADAPHLGIGLPRRYMGDDVIVGVVDIGIDLYHKSFLYPDGSTRIIALWDQTASSGIPPYGFYYGHECSGEDINSGKCPEDDCGINDGGEYLLGGHGTHVAGIAAGSAFPYQGVAPSALMIFVKTDLLEDDVIDAINYIVRKGRALGKPVVVNLSAGGNTGPHDGTTLFEKYISEIVDSGTTVVASAGNEGEYGTIHAGYTLSPQAEIRTAIEIPEGMSGEIHVETWFSGEKDLKIGVGVETSDGGTFLTQTGFISPPGESGDINLNYGTVRIDATSVSSYHLNKENMVDVSIVPAEIGSYRWEFIVFSSTTGESTRVDSWITSGNAVFSPFSGEKFTGQVVSAQGFNYFTFMGGDSRMTIDRPASAPGVIAVGSFTSKNSWRDSLGREQGWEAQIGDISSFSSRGPARKEWLTGMKPSVTAAGEVIVSSLSSCVNTDPSLVVEGGEFRVNVGTSMASPHVAGGIALLLDRNQWLKSGQITSLITGNAFSDAFTGSPPAQDIWGSGKLDVLAALKSTPESGMDATPPTISEIAFKTTMRSLLVSWKTDELASSRVKAWKAEAPDLPVISGAMTPSIIHNVLVDDLDPGQRYEFRVSSTDPRGNTSVSPVGSFMIQFAGRGCGGCRTSSDVPPGEGIVMLLLLLLIIRKISKKTPSALK